MKTKVPTRRAVLSAPVFCLIFATGCSMLIANYDQVLYNDATSLKAESLNLMDKATQPHEHHEGEIRELKLKLNKAYEYAKGRPRNDIVAHQWEILLGEILLDPAPRQKADVKESRLLSFFLDEWKKEGKLTPTYVEDRKKQIGRSFDQIIGLISGLPKPQSKAQ